MAVKKTLYALEKLLYEMKLDKGYTDKDSWLGNI